MSELRFLNEKNPNARKRILILEDDYLIGFMLKDTLNIIGYDSNVTTTGEDALKLQETALMLHQPFDGAIIDVVIPDGFHGDQVFSQMRERQPDLKALVSSGLANHDAVLNYEAYGFSAVLPKPYTFDLLKTIVEQTFGPNPPGARDLSFV